MPSSNEVAALLVQRVMASRYAQRALVSNPACRANLWLRIIKREKENNVEQTRICEAACIVGFAANSVLPADSARMIASFIKKPVTTRTLECIAIIVNGAKREELILNGRGGEGLSCTEKYRINHQRPKLLFSQLSFHREIMKRAALSLYRRLTLRGTLDEQLSAFFLILLNKC